MVKKLTLEQKKIRTAIGNKKDGFFVKAMGLPILAIILNLTPASITRAKPTSSKVPIIAQSNQPSVVSTSKELLSQGNQISVNGRTLPGTWVQQKGKKKNQGDAIYISDGALRQLIGVDLLNTNSPQLQPVQWFSSLSKPQVLTGLLEQGYRYLDITEFAKKARWKVQAKGNTLTIFTPKAKVKTIKQDKSSSQQQQLVIDLDRPTPWNLTAGSLIKKPKPKIQPKPEPKVPQLPFPRRTVVINPDIPAPKPQPPAREWIITIDGVASRNLISRYSPAPSIPQPIQLDSLFKKRPQAISPETPEPLIKQVEVVDNQTVIRLVVPFGLTPKVSTLPKPDRLVVDVRPDALVERSIDWAPGLLWRQQLVSLGNNRFPVVWLEIDPRTSKAKIRPRCYQPRKTRRYRTPNYNSAKISSSSRN